jgi:hypothetical protein
MVLIFLEEDCHTEGCHFVLRISSCALVKLFSKRVLLPVPSVIIAINQVAAFKFAVAVLVILMFRHHEIILLIFPVIIFIVIAIIFLLVVIFIFFLDIIFLFLITFFII